MSVRRLERTLTFVIAGMMMLLFATSASAVTWGCMAWSDDFEDGNATSNPTWTEGGTPGATQAVETWEGDYAYHLTASFVSAYGAGWSMAYVGDQTRDDRGILGWIDTSEQAHGDWSALLTGRFNTGIGFGTGYALGVYQDTDNSISAALYRADDTGYAELASEVEISDSYADVWARLLIRGDEVKGRVWTGNQNDEPFKWTLEATDNTYSDGYFGVGVMDVADDEMDAEARFDDIYMGVPEPSSLALVLVGLGVFAGGLLRKRQQDTKDK